MPPPAEGLASRLFLAPALRTQPDRRLVALVREGYEAASEEIVRRYGKPLGRYAASIVGGRSEDVLQDAFSKALPALCRDDAEIDLRPWLFRIVRNTALNELRDNPPSPEAIAEAIAGGGDPHEELERREELADLMRRLQALPERQRAAIVMRELEGLGHAEIGAALGLSGGGARQAIHRARQALRDGAGMLVPLPLLKAAMGGAGPATAELAGGVGAAGIGAGGAAGAGVALKATAATVLVAGAVGAGVALRDGTHPRLSAADAATAAGRTAKQAGPRPTLLADGSGGGENRLQSGGGGGDRGSHHSGDRGLGATSDRGSSTGSRDSGGTSRHGPGGGGSERPHSGRGSGSEGDGSEHGGGGHHSGSGDAGHGGGPSGSGGGDGGDLQPGRGGGSGSGSDDVQPGSLGGSDGSGGGGSSGEGSGGGGSGGGSGDLTSGGDSPSSGPGDGGGEETVLVLPDERSIDPRDPGAGHGLSD